MKKSELKSLIRESIREQLNEAADINSVATMLSDIEKTARKLLLMWTAGKYDETIKAYPNLEKLVSTVKGHLK